MKLLNASALALALCFGWSNAAQSQTPPPARAPSLSLSRVEAIRLAATHSPRAFEVRADSLVAAAEMALARQFENPTLGASYSKSEPRGHFTLDIPVDWPRARQSRINAARNGSTVAARRNTFARRALELDVDTAYTHAEAVAARAQLSRQTSRDADSLLVIARVRRDAGDASDLDVELATVFAGQMANTALADSLQELSSRMVLQTLVGISPDSLLIALGEHIALDSADSEAGSIVTDASAISGGIAALLPVAVAQGALESARLRLIAEQRRTLAAPSISLGVETVQSGTSGPLPTVGFTLPLPLFNRNNASIQLSQAEVVRAQGDLAFARIEQQALVLTANRDLLASRARLTRSAQLVRSANRIASMSLTAYREGAAPIATVLDAQRSAREALTQYAEDVAAVRIADSVLHFVTLTSDPTRP